MTTIRRVNLCLLAMVFGVGQAGLMAQAEEIPTGANFLLFPIGGRATALGQAAVADAGTSESIFWNPAGLASARAGEIAIHHAQTFISDNTVISGVFGSVGPGNLGLTAYLVDFGSQEVTIGPQVPTGRFSIKNLEFIGSYALKLFDRMSLGANYKVIQFRQDCSGDCGIIRSVSGTTHGFDLGLQYDIAKDRLRVGAAVQHAGFDLSLDGRTENEALPTKVQLGLVYQLRLAPPAADAEPLDLRFLLDVVDDWRAFGHPDVRSGIELGYGTLVRLRAGYASINEIFEGDDASSQREDRGPSVGIGVTFGRLSLDFSRIFFDSSNLDEPVYISLRAAI